MTLFTSLQTLSMCRDDKWYTVKQLEEFKSLTHDVMPFLTDLTFGYSHWQEPENIRLN